jgi:hypothetical protein
MSETYFHYFKLGSYLPYLSACEDALCQYCGIRLIREPLIYKRP